MQLILQNVPNFNNNLAPPFFSTPWHSWGSNAYVMLLTLPLKSQYISLIKLTALQIPHASDIFITAVSFA